MKDSDRFIGESKLDIVHRYWNSFNWKSKVIVWCMSCIIVWIVCLSLARGSMRALYHVSKWSIWLENFDIVVMQMNNLSWESTKTTNPFLGLQISNKTNQFCSIYCQTWLEWPQILFYIRKEKTVCFIYFISRTKSVDIAIVLKHYQFS